MDCNCFVRAGYAVVALWVGAHSVITGAKHRPGEQFECPDAQVACKQNAEEGVNQVIVSQDDQEAS